MQHKLKSMAAAIALTASAGAYADCGDVSVGAMGWASGEALAAVTQFVLEQGYGCNVTVIPTDTVPAVTSLAENGDPDVVPEVWTNGSPVYAELVEAGKVVSAAKTFSNGGEEGWWIPTYLADKHPELKTIEGILANPELVDNRFHNCPVGWGCRNINDNLSKVFGFEANGVELFNHGSGANLAASIAAAFEDQAPWLGYYWGPTAVLGKYEMTRVTLGEINQEFYLASTVPDADESTLGVTDFPASPVYNAMTTAFMEREPEVAEFISNMVMPNDVVSKMLAWKDENNASADETAAWLITNYKDMVFGMVNEEARKNLGALL